MRNRAYLTEIITDIVLIAAGTLLCRFLSVPGWAVTLGCGALMLLAHVLFLQRRYRAIARMAEQIDRVLHGQEKALVSDSDEGELAILQSELRKMTLRLSEQADSLRQEKHLLADAMADISHQLRTPLTSMTLVTQMLGRETEPDRRAALLRDLRLQQEKMSWLVETLLKMSRLDAGTVTFEPRDTPVRGLLMKAVEPLAVSFELRGIRLVIQSDGSTVCVDPAWTQEAVGNIVKNCMEHMKNGGSLRLTAQTTALYTQIVIEDSGEGFAAEDLPHVFERFYRGGNAAPDSIGIGLALARMVITGQDGTVTAGNRPQGGARFEIRFYKSTL